MINQDITIKQTHTEAICKITENETRPEIYVFENHRASPFPSGQFDSDKEIEEATRLQAIKTLRYRREKRKAARIMKCTM